MSVKELERIALDSQNGQEPKIEYPDSASIKTYESQMGIPLCRAILLMKRFFRKPIVCADIGGGSGYATYEINRMWGVQAFCIDRVLEINPKRLPRKRHIVADANNMPYIPSESFHIAVSYNSLKSPSPFREVYRILKPGGYAYIDLEPNFGQIREELIELNMGSALRVHNSTFNIHMPLPDLLKLIGQVEYFTKLMEEGDANGNVLLQNPDTKKKMEETMQVIEQAFIYDKCSYVYELHKPINHIPNPFGNLP